jgi:anti-sigma factor RsiW
LNEKTRKEYERRIECGEALAEWRQMREELTIRLEAELKERTEQKEREAQK